MIGYFNLFQEKMATEIRTVKFLDDNQDSIPIGTYLFNEFYCDDSTCDCQRVLIQVLRADDPQEMPKNLAMISFDWGEEPDEVWKSILLETGNPFLDILHPQCSYANLLMEFWYDMYQRDSAYAERIKRHYAEVRNYCGAAPKPHLFNMKPNITIRESAQERKKRYRSLQQRNVKKKSPPK